MKKTLLGILTVGILTVTGLEAKKMHTGGGFKVVEEAMCEGHQASGMFMKQVMEAQGMPDMVNIKTGTMHMIFTKNPEGVKTVQSAGMTFDKTMKTMAKKGEASVCADCVDWMNWMKDDKFTSELVKTKNGMIWMATSDDPAMVQKLHDKTNADIAKMAKMMENKPQE